MSKGPGRLERAIMDAVAIGESARAIYSMGGEFSTEWLCRHVYPGATQIEKRHRVAVLQVLHRLMELPSNPLQKRSWIITRGQKRGRWRYEYVEPRAPAPHPHTATAYHEAGHALAMLYLGVDVSEVWRDPMPWKQRRKPLRPAIEIRGVNIVPMGRVLREIGLTESQFLGIVISAAGPIAEGHYLGQWPWRRRGLAEFCEKAWEQGGAGDAGHIEQYLDDLHAEPAIRAAIRLKAEKKAQALIRSKPGWQFIEQASTDLEKMKRGRLGNARLRQAFRKAFGREPPNLTDWWDYPVTLARCRAGWLPPPDP